MSAQVTNLGGQGEISLVGLLRSSIAAKLVAMGILLAIIPALIVGVYSIVSTSKILAQNAIEVEQGDTLADSEKINTFLAGVESDTLFLSNSAPLREYVERVNEGDFEKIAEQQAELEKELLFFANQHPSYTQIRYIDETGQEVIRVDVLRPADPATLTSSSELQNKADRTYFIEAMNTPRSELYVSPLELNREQGEVEILPNGEYRPVIRYATPIYDNDGKQHGIVIINVLASGFLEDFKARAHVGDGEIALIINKDGYYVANSADPSKEWGDPQNLNSGETFTADYPEYVSILEGDAMQEITDDPTYFITSHPLVGGQGQEPFATLLTLHPRSATLAPVSDFRTALILILVGSVVLAGVVAVWLARRITRQVRNIGDLFDEIGIGNYDARVEVVSEDELGQAALGLNSMLDNTLALIQSQEERDAIQESIFKLLNEVSTVADGDLTVEAEVTSDMTGAIADSFNFMIEQLREIIAHIQRATSEVSSSAAQIQTTTTHLAVGSETQATQIIDTSAAIDEMSLSIQQVSDNAALSASVGEQSRRNAQIGAQAVENTVDSMARIREQVETTAEYLGRLDASSHEISQITKLINQIAERTSILAINASIQASEAGDAGRGFAVVAAEVERLSDRSAHASAQISRLTKTIQQDVSEVVTAMEATSIEVARGSDLANAAGEKLNEIQAVSTQLSELIQSISLAAQQQARGSGAIARSMNEIAEVTQQTAVGTKQANISIGNLASLADELRESVSQFKIEEELPDLLEPA